MFNNVKLIRAQNVLEKRFKCNVCHKPFPTRWHLKIHSRIHTGVKPFECAECSKSFSRKDYLEKHTRVHTGEKPFKCEVCGKSFSQKAHLYDHFQIHTDEKPFVCEFCGKSFLVKSNLRQHVTTHKDERPYSCDVCGKSFRQKRHIKIHLQTHLPVKPFICEFCGKSFLLKNNLKLHIVHHKGEKLFPCNVCGKAFVDKANLLRHTYIHTGEQPFSCEICGKSSSRKGFLKDHSFIHTSEKPYNCQYCDEKFRFKTNVRQHVRNKHGDLLSNTAAKVTDNTIHDTTGNDITKVSTVAKVKRTKKECSDRTSFRKSKSQSVDDNVKTNSLVNLITSAASDSRSREIVQSFEEQTGHYHIIPAADSGTSYEMVLLPEEEINGHFLEITPAEICETVQLPEEQEISIVDNHNGSNFVQETDFNISPQISKNYNSHDQFIIVGFLKKIKKSSDTVQSTDRKISYICGHCNSNFLLPTEFDNHIQIHLENDDILEEKP